MTNTFYYLDHNYIKKFVCDDDVAVERNQEILSKVLRKVSRELMKPEYKDKEMDILSGDKIESIIRETQSDLYSHSPVKKGRKDEKVLGDNFVLNTKDLSE